MIEIDEIISNAEFCANEYKKFSEIAPERSLTFKKYEEDHRQLAEWLKELKQLREQTRWIPVSRKLLNDRDWYLAVFKEKDTGFQLIPRVADYMGENNWQIIDEDGIVKEYRDILECVAWTTLPEPYKAESEG